MLPAFRGLPSSVDRTFAHDLRQGALPNEDKTYLAQSVSARTGLNLLDAEKRVTDVFGDAQESADRVRKAIAHFALWLFVALLSGAFCGKLRRYYRWKAARSPADLASEPAIHKEAICVQFCSCFWGNRYRSLSLLLFSAIEY